MDIPDPLGDGDSRRRVTKRTTIVVFVIAIIALGAGAGITATFFDSDVEQIPAESGPAGAQASVSIETGSTASISFADTAVASTSTGVGLQQLNISVDEGGTLELTGVSKVSNESVDTAPTNRTVGYLSIDHSGDAEIDSVTFTVSVSESELAAANIDPATVTLYRLSDGEWQPLETALQSTAGDVYTYEATSPGLSLFAVGPAPAAAPPSDDNGQPDDAPEDTIPTETTTPTDTTTPPTTQTPTETPTSPPEATQAPVESTGNEGGGADNDDAPATGVTFPEFTLTLNATATVDSVANDGGDVDVLIGVVNGTLSWSQPQATRIEVTVSVSDGDSTQQVRSANRSLTNETAVTLEDVLVDTRMVYATGATADEFSVPTDGQARTYTRTVTVEVVVYSGTQQLATTADEEAVTFTVTNQQAASSGTGGSNAGAG